ncbi:MAG: glutamate-5-semialdehyde dehydrogenase [Nitrospirota bacterium]|nr:glutamate-5-semialdehyde dehydrogenase [Nitrospirota bacterium]
MVEVPLKLYMQELLKQAKARARPMASLTSQQKNQALQAMADALEAQSADILEANEQDLELISKVGDKQIHRHAVERIRITPETIQLMVDRLLDYLACPDPVGEMNKAWMTPDGLQVHMVRAPIGVLGVITDLGPILTVESFGMCLKTNNVCVFRGGAEWMHTNLALSRCLQEAAVGQGVPEGALVFLDRGAPEAALEMARQPQYVQAVIPRGRASLRNGIVEHARVPVIGFDGGLCHVYVDEDVDIPLAQTIAVNAKVQSPTEANSMDTLLVHQAASRHLLPGLTRRLLQEYRVVLHGCPKTVSMLGVLAMTGHLGIKDAEESDWDKKFQSLTLNIKVVKDRQEALDHIAKYSPGHTDTIVTRDYDFAMQFAREVDSSAVLVNASTRLHEGESLGLGPDLGGNSRRLHARGPLTLSKLTIEKYMVLGTGQLRHPHPIPQEYQDAMMLSSKF